MFAKATRNFVRQIDPEGSLIPVSRLNNSDKLTLLSLVVKRNRIWFWQQHKYLPSDFTLSDVLLGEPPLCPVVNEMNLLKYEGTFGGTRSGDFDAEVWPMNINVKGKGSSELQSSFGELKKQEVDVRQLLKDSCDRALNLEHCFVQQTRDKRKKAFGVVKEKIVTTQHCSITQEIRGQGSCGAALKALRAPAVKVNVVNNGEVAMDRKVSLEIPPQTVIAYSIIELEIRCDGQFELCLQPDVRGGFESDTVELESSFPDLLDVDGPIAADQVCAAVLDELRPQFQWLLELQTPTRSKLFQLLTEVLTDSPAVSVLESILDDWCSGENFSLGKWEKQILEKPTVKGFLDLLQPHWGDQNQTDSQSVTAVYMLVSAMNELQDSDLVHLSSCSIDVLQGLHRLVSQLATGKERPLQEMPLSPLLEEVNQKAEQLNMALRVEAGPQAGLRLLLVCVVIRGLATLSSGL